MRRWRDDFARLNIEWLERWFTVEPVDREVLDDPGDPHLAQQAAASCSQSTTATVRTAQSRSCATGDGEVELTKMAVDPAIRGAGIGRKLMAGALDAFTQMGGGQLFLETNTRLLPAIKLYESVGFRHQPTARRGTHYQRADVYMVWQPNASD